MTEARYLEEPKKYVAYDKIIQPNEPELVIRRGPTKSTFNVITPSGGITANSTLTNVQYEINVPTGAILSRRMSLRPRNLRITSTVAGNGANNPALTVYKANNDAPRPWIVNRLLTSVNAQLNTNGFNTNVHSLMPYYENIYYKEHLYEGCNSSFPSQPDLIQNYSTAVSTEWSHLGLGTPERPGRGAFPLIIDQNDNLGAVDATGIVRVGNVQGAGGDALFTEPLLLELLSPDRYDAQEGLRNVQQIQLDLTFSATPQSFVWSHVAPAGEAGAFVVNSVTFDGLDLLVSYHTPPPTLYKSIASYPYVNPVRYSSSLAQLNAGAQRTDNSQTINLNGLPHGFIIYISEQDQNKTALTTDFYTRIDSVAINLNNDTGILSSASRQQLYEISQANGYPYPYQIWCAQEFGGLGGFNMRGAGSLLFLKATDLSLPSNLAPGCQGKITFSINISHTNRNTANMVNPILSIVALYDSMVQLTDAYSAKVYSPLFSQEEALQALAGDYPVLDMDDFDSMKMSGGRNIFQKIGSAFKKAVSYAPLIKKGAQILSKTHIPGVSSAAGVVGDVLDLAGAGQLGGRTPKRKAPKRKAAQKRKPTLADYF